MRFSGSLLALVVLLALTPAAAQSTWDRPLADPVPYHLDSGALPNGFTSSKVVFRDTVHLNSAGWMRLYFGEVALPPGSFLRLTSLLDGEVQELDAAALEMWTHSSAYFNGDSVTVELVAGPGTQNNRVTVDQVAWELQPELPLAGCDPGCCGPTDDRVPSNEDWSARFLPAGCTASIYNTDSCAVSAGHCIGGAMVLEFKVPLSSPNCNLNHPPIAEQFPVLQFAFTNGGVGNDWSAMTTGTNNLGQTAFQRYGVFKPIASTQAVVGQPATVWGYGVDDVCTANQTQQTSSGFIEEVSGNLIRYSIDVTFGNSGSGVLRNGNDIVGIVTHCCCPNQGTLVTHPAFVAAREQLCPTAAPQAATLLSASVVIGIPQEAMLSQMTTSDNNYFTVGSVTQGARNNTLTEVTAQSPANTVSQLNVTVELGPANASPVFSNVQLFNFDTGMWDNLNFGTVPTVGDTVINVPSVPSPNSYVDGTGKVKVRVSETARQPQTPSGFLKLVDQVLVTVQP